MFGQVCLLLKQASPIIWSQPASPLQYQADQERPGDSLIMLVLLPLMDWVVYILCVISDEQLGEAIDEEEADGGSFQPDLEETGVLAVNIGQLMWYKENSISRENLRPKYSLNWLQRHVGGLQMIDMGGGGDATSAENWLPN